MEKSPARDGTGADGGKSQSAIISLQNNCKPGLGKPGKNCINASMESGHAAADDSARLISTAYSHSLSPAV
jgi:hypothetical protein